MSLQGLFLVHSCHLLFSLMLQAATASDRPVIMAQHIVTPALPITFIMIY
jgi:hypothetical protein